MRESKTRRMTSNIRRGERERNIRKETFLKKGCRVDDDARDEQMTFVLSGGDGKQQTIGMRKYGFDV
jgi:hypothetical protein